MPLNCKFQQSHILNIGILVSLTVAYMRLLKIAMTFEKVFLTIKNVLDQRQQTELSLKLQTRPT
jgi:hypothetical protein